MMKTKILLLLVISFKLSYAQQKDSTEIVKEITTFFRYSSNFEIDSLLNKMHTKLFTLAPKKQIKESMQQMLDDKNLKIGFSNYNIQNISPTFTYNSVKYALVKYNFTMNMQFYDNGKLSENSLSMQYALPGLKQKFGKDNVRLIDSTQTVFIDVKGLMYAINDNKKDWKFLEKKEEQKSILKYLIPQAVINKLK
ncbi:MAG: hypothetical protein ACOVMM_13060 [Chitinophagaceae bacterium]